MKTENRYYKKYRRKKNLAASDHPKSLTVDNTWPLLAAAGFIAIHFDLTRKNGENLERIMKFGSECLFNYPKNKSIAI